MYNHIPIQTLSMVLLQFALNVALPWHKRNISLSMVYTEHGTPFGYKCSTLVLPFLNVVLPRCGHTVNLALPVDVHTCTLNLVLSDGTYTQLDTPFEYIHST